MKKIKLSKFEVDERLLVSLIAAWFIVNFGKSIAQILSDPITKELQANGIYNNITGSNFSFINLFCSIIYFGTLFIVLCLLIKLANKYLFKK